MADKGLSRIVAREVFGLAVRVLGLYVGFISGYALIVDLFGDYRHASVIASSIAGLIIAVLLIKKGDWFRDFAYGPPAPGPTS